MIIPFMLWITMRSMAVPLNNPDISMRQAMEDILEDEEMSLENAVPVDYEDLMAEVEEAGRQQMQLAQLLRIVSSILTVIKESWTMDSEERAVDTSEGAMQFTKSKGYLTVQATEEAIFIFYDSDLLKSIPMIMKVIPKYLFRKLLMKS